jgi:hypothetical protein
MVMMMFVVTHFTLLPKKFLNYFPTKCIFNPHDSQENITQIIDN